ncbi:hypothetical protein [Streptomyces sp. KR80]|uniref:hypothetical protein n=1 Tax=Streptomyces sp. KR80 TaxID=3457426 RepID=UPI003FD242F5
MVNGWVEAVRQQLSLGRLLPLGGPADGAWITEHAASGALRRAVAGLGGVRLDRVRISLAPAEAGAATSAPHETPAEAAVPPPASALPPEPLRIEADCAASTRLPLPEAAEELRGALFGAAAHALGLRVSLVDVRVTDLLPEAPAAAGAAPDAEPQSDTGPAPYAGAGPAPESEAAGPGPETAEEAAGPGPLLNPPQRAVEQPSGDPAVPLAAAAAAVPGVVRLAPALGGLARPVRVVDSADPERRHVQVQLAVATTHRALDVTGAVRAAVTAAAAADTSAPVTVAVLVTAVEPP